MDKNFGRKYLRTILAILTFIGLGWAGYKYLDPHAMEQAWDKFSWGAIGWLLVIPALYLLFKSFRFVNLLQPISDAPKGDVLAGFAASQAASLLPAGVAMRAAMMHRLGVPVEKSSGPILANSASDQFLLLSAGLVLCYYYEDLRISAFVLTTILLVLIAALSIKRSREWLKNVLSKMGKKVKQEERVEDFLHSLPYLADWKLFGKVMFWTVLANAMSLTALCLVVASLDLPVEPWPLAAAFVIPNLLGRLSPFPAGAGVVEAGMIGFMAAQTSMSYDQAAVATVIFRVVDTMMPAVYGGVCHLFFLPDERANGETARVVA